MPLPAKPYSAANDLGLGSILADQVAGETEEERKKRMLAQTQMGNASGSAAAVLLGGMGGARAY